jgi:hypothetical protein
MRTHMTPKQFLAFQCNDIFLMLLLRVDRVCSENTCSLSFSLIQVNLLWTNICCSNRNKSEHFALCNSGCCQFYTSVTLSNSTEKLSVASATSLLTAVLGSSAREMHSVLSMKHSVTATKGMLDT